VVWVVGMRLEPEVVSGVFGQAAGYRQAFSESRLRSVPLGRFTDHTIGEYLERRLPDGMPSGVQVSRVAEVTRGIPLAVALVCDLLNAGQDPEVVLRPVPELGRPSAVVRELADRYLTHAVHCPPLRDDLPLLYGLALLYSDRLDPDLLAALWNVQPTDVADVTTRLAARHDFVLHDSRRLHDDIRDTIRLYLLDDALRAQQRPMNRRAVTHLRDRLTQLGPQRVDDQITSEDWQSLATALLWHTFWEDNRAGIQLLCHLLPAAHVVAEPFAAALLSTAEFFLPVLSTQQKQMITALLELRPTAVLLASGPGETLREAADSRRVHDVLERQRDGDSPVLADDIPRSAYLSLLRVKQASNVRDQSMEALAPLEEADRVLPEPTDPSGASSQALARLAEHVADVLIFSDRYNTQRSPEALRAARLAIRHDPQSSRAWWLFGLCLPRQEALQASEEAIRLDPEFAAAHNLRGVSLASSGREEESLAEYDEAVRIRPEFTVAHANRCYALTRLRRFEDALAASEEAIRLDSEYATAHSGRGTALRHLGRFEESLAACDEVIRLGSDDTWAYNGRGLTLQLLGDIPAAMAAYDKAIRLDPGNVWAHANRGMTLRRHGRLDDALDACDEAVRLSPDNDWAHASMAGTLKDLGRLQEALDSYDQAIRIDPQDAWLHTKRGECLLLQGQHAAAVTSLRRAAELQPADALEAQVLLAALTWQIDQVRAAHLAATALEQPGMFLPAFQRAELRAVARLLAGDPAGASAELSSVAAIRLAGDLFRQPLHDLLDGPRVPGLAQLLTIWKQINKMP
jgi:tetratricopeptide (TPR) repeat protein